MVRTQIQLTESQAMALKLMAGKEGVSMAELIRLAVDRFLREADVKDDARERILLAKEAAGKYVTGLADLAESHDRYFTSDAAGEDR